MKMSQRGGRLPCGSGWLIVIGVFIVTIFLISISQAGIFRKERVFPLIKNRLIINERPATPATPNPPPIIIPVPPVPPSKPELTKEEIKEIIEAIVSTSSNDSDDSDSNGSNPMLPIGGAAAGGLYMLLRYARSAVSFIKGGG